MATQITAQNLLRPTAADEMQAHGDGWKNIFQHFSAENLKDKIARNLADRCRDNEAFKALAEKLHNSSYQCVSYTDHVIEACSTLVHCWAISSNNSLLALAIQTCAAKEFGLVDYAQYGKWHDKANVTEDLSKKEWSEHYGAIRFFLRQMYNVTQEDFKKRNITHVLVFRGAGVEYFAHRENKNGISQAPRSRKISLRPLNAFSTNMETSCGFGSSSNGHVLIGAWVPVEKILCNARTGFGCRSEYEMVVMGGKDAWWMHFSTCSHTAQGYKSYYNPSYNRPSAYELLSQASNETKRVGRPRKSA